MNVKRKKPKKMEMKIGTKGQERCNLEGRKEGRKDRRKNVRKAVGWLCGRQTWRELDSFIIHIK